MSLFVHQLCSAASGAIYNSYDGSQRDVPAVLFELLLKLIVRSDILTPVIRIL